jgi:L-ascorbate metabolism protein UlaG (beta-lactamase superfamily)
MSVNPAEAQITFAGHATLLIEMEGVRLLTDPILRNRVTFLRRHSPLRLAPDTLQDVEIVLISHLHFDHLDLPSLRRLGLDRRLIVPYGAASWLRRSGFTHVEEVRVGESITVGSVTITATPADHATERHRFGPRIESCVGYLIQGGQTVYFAGDTDLFPEMAEIAPALDLALLPIWGWGPTLGAGHMDPQRAAMALQLLKPRYAIPIHWGTLLPLHLSGWRKAPRFLAEPPQLFAAFAAELAPTVIIEILPPGESWHLPT